MDLKRAVAPNPYDYLPPVPSFPLTSPDASDGAPIGEQFVEAGGNESPALEWSGLPAGTRGLAVTVFDPDAPSPSGWWHWLVAGLPPSLTGLPRGAGQPGGAGLPSGAVQLRNDSGRHAYDGPAPPPGDYPHRYFFAVHALDTDSLGIGRDDPATVLGFQLSVHAIARGLLVPTYQTPG